MLLDKASLAARHAVSKEAGREAMSGVLIDETKVVATDGYSVVLVAHSELKEQDFPVVPGMPTGHAFKACVVPVDVLDSAAKGLPKRNTIPVLGTASLVLDKQGDSEQVTLTVTDLDQGQTFRARVPDVDFPAFEKVIPKDEPDVAFTFNLAILNRVARVGLEGRPDKHPNDTVTLYVKRCGNGKDGKPKHSMGIDQFLVRVAGNDRFLGVVMPMAYTEGPLVESLRKYVHRSVSGEPVPVVKVVPPTVAPPEPTPDPVVEAEASARAAKVVANEDTRKVGEPARCFQETHLIAHNGKRYMLDKDEESVLCTMAFGHSAECRRFEAEPPKGAWVNAGVKDYMRRPVKPYTVSKGHGRPYDRARVAKELDEDAAFDKRQAARAQKPKGYTATRIEEEEAPPAKVPGVCVSVREAAAAALARMRAHAGV